jgi:hypothetical protein
MNSVKREYKPIARTSKKNRYMEHRDQTFREVFIILLDFPFKSIIIVISME